MISIDDNGVLHIPIGYSLWVIDKLLGEGKELTFSLFKNHCTIKSRELGIIDETESIDDSICQHAWDEGIERLNHLLKLNKKKSILQERWNGLRKTSYYVYKEKYRIFPEEKYRFQDINEIPPCKIEVPKCVKFIDKLLSSGKVYSTFALYSELEKEYCWLECFVVEEDIENNRAELYRHCYSGVQKQCLKSIKAYLIAKDMGEFFIRTRRFEYKKEYDYHYDKAGITVLNNEGVLPEHTRYEKFKIAINNLVEAEINDINKKRKKANSKNKPPLCISISDIELIIDKFKSIADGIEDIQIAAYLDDKLDIISDICSAKEDGWQEEYISQLEETRGELKSQGNKLRSLKYADLLETYAKLLGKYGYSREVDQTIKDKWFDVICSFYNEMINIAHEYDSKERCARYSIKYANFLRKENQYNELEEKYIDAIKIYREITKDEASVTLNKDFAYALRSLSKFYSDYDRIADAIKVLEESLNYTEEFEQITDTLIQLSMRYAEYGDNDKVDAVLNDALHYYEGRAQIDKNYYANIANVYIKLLRNISPTNIKASIRRGRKHRYEEQCVYYISLYEKLMDKKISGHDKIYAHALTSLALYYYDTGQEVATEKCKKALAAHEAIRNNEEHYNINIINLHFYLGRALTLPVFQYNNDHLYESKTEIMQALDFYSKLYDAMAERGLYVPSIKKGLADTNLALAETYDYMGNTEEARIRYKTAIEFYSDLSHNEQAKDKYKELLKKAKDLLRLLD